MVGPEITRRLPYYEGLRLNVHQYLGIAFFLGGSLLHNIYKKKPLSASIPKHLAWLAAGLLTATELRKYLDNRRSLKVSVIEDYICKHPDDFPLVTPKKYKDILLPWTPAR
ncbi:hypothetical protein BsWGS_17564 [Bradybaena similaris]